MFANGFKSILPYSSLILKIIAKQWTQNFNAYIKKVQPGYDMY